MPLNLASTGGGSVSLTVPSTASSFTATVPAATGTLLIPGQASAITAGTTVVASGTSVDFTGIPSWVKRITVMFYNVSTTGSSNYIVQIGSGSFTTTGYVSYVQYGSSGGSNTNGFMVVGANNAAYNYYGSAVLNNPYQNLWVCGGTGIVNTVAVNQTMFNGGVGLGGTLDRVRVTTVAGTDTFDAGYINIFYE